METELSKLHLGDFRKLYEFIDGRLGKSYCVDTAYEGGGDLHKFAGVMCIRIYKSIDKAIIKIFDPTYSQPSEDGKVTVKVTIKENDYNPETKEIPLVRMEEDSFFTLIESIMNFELIDLDDDDDEFDEIDKALDN